MAMCESGLVGSSCVRLLTSDLTVDPPEGSFGHAVEFDEGLSDPARLQ